MKLMVFGVSSKVLAIIKGVSVKPRNTTLATARKTDSTLLNVLVIDAIQHAFHCDEGVDQKTTHLANAIPFRSERKATPVVADDLRMGTGESLSIFRMCLRRLDLRLEKSEKSVYVWPKTGVN